MPSTQAASGVLSCFSGGLQGAYFILFYFIYLFSCSRVKGMQAPFAQAYRLASMLASTQASYAPRKPPGS
jgi:hypothetical protein